MEQLIDIVISLLDKIRDAYSRMLAISEKKQTCIIKGNAQDLNTIVGEEWKLLKEIAELEQRRVKAVSSLQADLGLNETEMTLSELEKRADEDQKKKLKKISLDLKNTIAAQKKINDQNMALLRLHFEYMNFMTSNYLQDLQSGDIYGQSGVLMDVRLQNAGIIDSQV